MPVFFTKAMGPQRVALECLRNRLYEMPNESIEERERVQNELTERCEKLLEKGIIGWAEVFGSDGMPKRFGNKELACKYYPDSSLTKKDLMEGLCR